MKLCVLFLLIRNHIDNFTVNSMKIGKIMKSIYHLIHFLLQCECQFHCACCCHLRVNVRLVYVAQYDASTALIEKLHQLHGMSTLLIGGSLEKLMESRKCNIVAIKVKGLEQCQFTLVCNLKSQTLFILTNDM